jgi:2,3-diaminopropionate biosynthesis protein SbnB
MFPFDVISGPHIKAILEQARGLSLRSVAQAYLDHHDGKSDNPPSHFLRFQNDDLNRIIALPAAIGGQDAVAGIKWIASFPGNLAQGFPRASAVLVLNDRVTGYPFALLEASLISAARTAASAVLATTWMNRHERRIGSLSVVGAGLIARATLDAFDADGWLFDTILVHDTSAATAAACASYLKTRWPDCKVVPVELAQAVGADVVLFTTTAGTPYVVPPTRFKPGQIVLNISLRDIAPELILDAVNIVDDINHCLKANTSAHLAEQLSGNRDFVTGNLAQLMRSEISLDRSRPLIFSPFGMGILDLALGREIYREAVERRLTTPVADFFSVTPTW